MLSKYLLLNLAQNEGGLIKAEQNYPVWSPIDAFDAANVMLKALKDSEVTQ